jgi:cell wall-associated NlpC family hydrolase
MISWSPYVGLEFEEFHCWALVRKVYIEQLGIELPSYGEISSRDLGQIARKMKSVKDDGWIAVEKPELFDVCLMRAPQGGQLVVHVGVMISPTRLLHVEEKTATVIVPIKHFSVSGRILGYRRKS